MTRATTDSDRRSRTSGGSSPSHVASATHLLAAAVIATTLAGVAGALRGDGSAINAFLFMHLEVPHLASVRIEQTGATATLALAIVAWVWRQWLPLLPVTLWLFAEAAARYQVGGQAFSDHAFVTQSLRYTTALALALLYAAREPSHCITISRGLLRISIAAVFAGHGIEALYANPSFIDLVISSAQNMAGIRVSEAAATTALEFIGLMDLSVAAIILLRPFPQVAWFAAAWGTIAAFSRLTASGWGAYPDVLLRFSYGLAPLAFSRLSAPPANHAERDSNRHHP